MQSSMSDDKKAATDSVKKEEEEEEEELITDGLLMNAVEGAWEEGTMTSFDV